MEKILSQKLTLKFAVIFSSIVLLRRSMGVPAKLPEERGMEALDFLA